MKIKEVKKAMKQAKNGNSITLAVNGLQVIRVLKEMGATIKFDECATQGFLNGFKISHCPIWTGKNQIVIKKIN